VSLKPGNSKQGDIHSVPLRYPGFSALSKFGLSTYINASRSPQILPFLYTATMPAGDYTPVTTGALKLKGVNPSSKVGKHKKKRPKPNETTSSSKIDSTLQAAEDENGSTAVERTAESKEKDIQDTITSESKEEESQSRGKTEAELRHEERRRRRVCPLPFPLHSQFPSSVFHNPWMKLGRSEGSS